jgi:pimeloyl-ACP methyl ester carboxylesterase
MVPGLGLGTAAWLPTVQALGSHGVPGEDIVIAPLPGYGLPAGRREDLGPPRLARRLVEERLPAGQRQLLLGHSASCQVVVHAARLAPERVGGLVLAGPTTDPAARSWPRLVRRWCATAWHEPLWQVPALLRQYRRTGPVTMVRAMDAARPDRIEAALADVRCPVLVVRGVHDRIVPAGWAQRLAGQTLRGESVGGQVRSVATLPAGGHMVPLTEPEHVAAAVARFWTARPG